MIKYFTIKNFRSIKNENILEFDAHLKNSTYPAHPVIGFAGANASGKTNVLRSLTFVLWFMQNSFLRLDKNDDIPCEAFYTLSKLPTEFHLIFAEKSWVDGQEKIIDYEYKLCLTKEKVLTEKLNYCPYEKSELVYFRHDGKVELGDSVSPIDIKDLRENCSIISLASQFASQNVANACKDYAVKTNLTFAVRNFSERHKISLLENELKDHKLREKIQPHLKMADVGIEKIKISSEKQTIFMHKIEDKLAPFEYHLESAGTLEFLLKLFYFLQALEEGAVFVVDEIELKLHQNLVAYLLGLFKNKTANKHGAQLICSFHNSYFMEFLEPEQLWFAEKNDQGETELFSAAAFTDIKNLYEKDLEMLYRVGRFGAKPREI